MRPQTGTNITPTPTRSRWTPERHSIVAPGVQMVHLVVTLGATTTTDQRLVAALRTLMGAVRLEPGCESCSVWTTEGEEDDRVLVHYEERWAGEQAMEARVRSDRFTMLLEVVESAPDDPSVEFQFVAKQHGLEYVEAVRGTAR